MGIYPYFSVLRRRDTERQRTRLTTRDLSEFEREIYPLASNNNNNAVLEDTQITSISVPSDVTMAGTTTFVDPINVIKSDVITDQERSDLYPVRDQTISDFLAKPAKVASVSWNNTQVVNTSLASNTVRTDLLANPLWVEKIHGFNFFRGTAVYRVVINATPFHAGCLKFGFIPMQGSQIDLPSVQPTWRYAARASVSTLPGPFMDVRDSTAIIRVPFVSTVDYTTIETTDGPDWGTWSLRVMSSLLTGASSQSSLNVSVYLHFEDVELAVPLHPQSGASRKSFKGAKFMSKVGSAAKQEINDAEAEVMSSGGTISRGLMAAGKLASVVSEVPMLSAIAAPTSWLLRGAATVASWFGFSKPDLDSVPTYISRIPQPNMANATGIDTSPTLALYHDNAIAVKPDFGLDGTDEMNFDHLKRIPMVFRDFFWLGTALPGTLLNTFDVRPSDLSETFSPPGPSLVGNLTVLAPFAYLSTFFLEYRGSIDLHFRIVKTDYHSGRLSFHFVPAIATVPSLAEQRYLLREIVDIKDKSEVTIRIPYLQYQKYIGVDDSIGTLYVTVVNELRAPESCAPNVNILVSASAGQDFEYAIPGQDNTAGSVVLPILPQMGAAEIDSDQTVVAEPIGNYPSMPSTNEPSSMSIGEKFVSLRQLLLRYTRLSFVETNPVYGSNSSFELYPYFVGLPQVSEETLPIFSMDALSRLAHGFAFMRGSIRILTVPPSSSDSSRGHKMWNVPSRALRVGGQAFENNVDPDTITGSTYSVIGARFGSSHANAYVAFDATNIVPSARIPYYCENHSTAILPNNGTSDIPTNVWDPNMGLIYLGQGPMGGGPIEIQRSIGEDFQLGYFLGFPPVYTT